MIPNAKSVRDEKETDSQKTSSVRAVWRAESPAKSIRGGAGERQGDLLEAGVEKKGKTTKLGRLFKSSNSRIKHRRQKERRPKEMCQGWLGSMSGGEEGGGGGGDPKRMVL